MMSDICGSSLFMSLPDDVFIVLSDSLSPRDLCSISLCWTSLNTLVSSEKVCLSQCESLKIVKSQDLVEWRNGVMSYKCLCKFMFSVQPLLGIWVHQNPELGNVVYVMPGFLSLGPLGLVDGSLLWAPVFEIICDKDGEYFYPGSVKPVERSCNVLLLEAEPRMQSNGCKLLRSKSLGHPHLDWESMRWIHRSDGGEFSRSQRVSGWNSSVVAFDRLTFEDRQKLLELAMSQVGLKVSNLASGPLFPRFGDAGDGLKKDLMLLSERRLLPMKMYQYGGRYTDLQTMSGKPSNTTRVVASKLKKSLEPPSGTGALLNWDDSIHLHCSKRRSVAVYLKDSLKLVLGNFFPTGRLYASHLHEFLWSGDMIGLSLHASTLKQPTTRAWQKMHDDKYALYKLPMWNPMSGQEYAGLWGGTFGWLPGRPSEDKGKALFFLLLSYEESEGQQLLTTTKILEGNHYLSTDPFPLETDGDLATLDIKHTYTGEGIADGYGFRYPGSNPGSLFVIQDGLLAFLLRKGERVPALPPILNFTYLTRSYSKYIHKLLQPHICALSITPLMLKACNA
ncbi:hypothetical protein MKX01_034142 [Papaver californicum]|nr:hypothetical protein MKX01_034142 [Papaver californicum]